MKLAKNIPPRAEARVDFIAFTARLKSCPVTKPSQMAPEASFSATCLGMQQGRMKGWPPCIRPRLIGALPPFHQSAGLDLYAALRLLRANEQDRNVNQLDQLLGDGPKDQRVPTGGAVRGNHKQIDVLPLDHILNASSYVVVDFNT